MHASCRNHPVPAQAQSLFILLLALLCALPSHVSAADRQQHNVWFNDLFISGIAVDESSDDVFFSDAASNRVVRQSANGALLVEYRSSFFSPMQLVYHDRKLYVADSTSSRVGVVDVQRSEVSYSSPSAYLSSCSALVRNDVTGGLWVVDGWGSLAELWSPANDTWTERYDLSDVCLLRHGCDVPRLCGSAAVAAGQWAHLVERPY